MELTPRTMTVLNNFSTINKGIRFSAGQVLKTCNTTKTIIAEAKLDTDVDRDFRLYDLSRFLATLSLFKKPNLELVEDRVILTEAKTRINYLYADEEKVITPSEKGFTFPDIIFTAHLSWERIKEMSKAAKILGLRAISFEDKGDGLFLRAIDPDKKIKDTYNVELGESTGQIFSIVIMLDNLKLIEADYAVEVGWKTAEGDKKGRGLSRWTGVDFPIQYVIMLDRESRVHG